MQAILTLNSGSSSIKFAVFSLTEKGLKKEYSGLVDKIIDHPHLKIKTFNDEIVLDQILAKQSAVDSYENATNQILLWLKKHDVEIVAAGHRIVHGAMRYRTATVLNPEIFAFLETLNSLAPLHQPYNLTGVKILAAKFPSLTQVACFDTAFHTTCNELTQLFAIPKYLTERGIRRYGFHGLSYEYIVSQFDKYLDPDKADGRIIIAHLGQGASMCAVKNRKSLATTLSFSALDGLPMGTRCGNLDPGVILYLLANEKMNYKQIEHLLFKESGLFGVSGGISSDMRTLLNSDHPDARLAIDLFVYRIGAWIGMLAAELQGLDGLIFTAGIGENSSLIREKICEKAAWLGAKIDLDKNKKGSTTIHHSDSKIAIHIIPTDEETIIAEETLKGWRKITPASGHAP